MNCGVYQIVNKLNGKFYIGSSVELAKRIKHHRTLLRASKHQNQHLQSAWVKYGEDAFEFKVLLVCAPEMVLFYEQLLIDGLRPQYNISPTAGSIYGHRHTAIARQNMAQAQRRWRKKYEWKGQSLCLSDIAAMECVDASMLISRVLGMGMDVDRAIKLERRPFRQTFEHDGREQTIKQWASELGMHPRRLTYWLDSGMSISDCITRLNRQEKALSFAEFCKLSGVNLQTTKSRVQKGMGVMEAVAHPVVKKDQSWRIKA